MWLTLPKYLAVTRRSELQRRKRKIYFYLSKDFQESIMMVCFYKIVLSSMLIRILGFCGCILNYLGIISSSIETDEL